MRYDRLAADKRYFLSGATHDPIAAAIQGRLLAHGGEPAGDVSDCDIFIYIAQPQALADADTRACFLDTQRAARGMMKKREGCAVYVRPTEGMRSFGYAVAMDLCKYNIRVNCVDAGDPLGGEEAVADGIADAVLYLASAMSANVTGQTLAVGPDDAPPAKKEPAARRADDRRLWTDAPPEVVQRMLTGGEFTVVDDIGQCDALMLTASDAQLCHIAELDAQDFDRMWQQNYLRIQDIVHAQAQRMQREGGGDILLLAADNIVAGARLTSAFSASVGALAGLMRRIDSLYPQVRCNILMAGARINPLAPEYERLYGREAAVHMAAMDLIPSRGAHADIADAAAFLLSRRSAPVSGQCLPVNGGIRTLAHANMAYYLNGVIR